MVSYQARTARFGSPPDPENPTPHYPGISFNKFDPMEALTIYREGLNKERNLRSNALHNMHYHPGPIVHRQRLSDLMPGYNSILETSSHLGYTAHPINNRRLPPEEVVPPSARSSSCGGSSVAASRLGSGVHTPAASSALSKVSKVLLKNSSSAPIIKPIDKEREARAMSLILNNVNANRPFTFC
eukprot:TRINITY_DN67008_c0_g1_i1.p1 TRINITY_DN67008_c0_g1~~TRINITY_DN67008_c0_g1_i1.p1  ORF type:complete len:211 (-),score=11.28 TRINITY_DN67008_c0_g1_i1:128-682(-)